MSTAFLKRIASTFPFSWQYELKRLSYRLQMRFNQFASSEPEYALLPTLLTPGDCVIDVGANVGHYTKRLSDLAGVHGRVIAFEPVPETFALLASNSQRFQYANVTLVNAAVSDRSAFVGIDIPTFETGRKNFSRAHLALDKPAGQCVLTLRLDALDIPERVILVKIDTEGHEAAVLQGMADLLQRDHPTLIVETHAAEVEANLCSMGYRARKLGGSPNILFQHSDLV
jgi:FkbM family methyltransferase